jgi:gamma-glutamyl-gamma-aminobutyrate hydrolase PuuD
MKKVFIVEGHYAYAQLFIGLGCAITHAIDDADLVCFTGGADVTPAMYGDFQHKYTTNSFRRDEAESRVFHECIRLNKPMVGICRGGQFLNVMSGGRMYQHVERHTAPHEITDLETGDVIFVSSTHHQMMMPSKKGLLVASSQLGGAREWYDGEVFKRDISKEDIEVVYYEHTNCLCFQPHPEFFAPEYVGMQRYFKGLLEKYLMPVAA